MPTSRGLSRLPCTANIQNASGHSIARPPPIENFPAERRACPDDGVPGHARQMRCLDRGDFDGDVTADSLRIRAQFVCAFSDLLSGFLLDAWDLNFQFD